jgi:hypothetical protein
MLFTSLKFEFYLLEFYKIMSLDNKTKKTIEINVMASVRNILLVVLCAGMMGMGMVKMVGVPELVERFAEWGFTRWMVFAIGVLETGISIMLFIKPVRKYAILAFIVLLISALSTHVLFGDAIGAIGPFAVLTGTLVFWWLDSKVG